METQTLTISEALKQGYTHFMMGKVNRPCEEEFTTHELNDEKLRYAIIRSTDEDCDDKQAKDESDIWFGLTPLLCSMPYFPKLNASQLSQLVCDWHELDDDLPPVCFHEMANTLHEDEAFLEGLALINKALAQYKSYTDTNILVTLDSEIIRDQYDEPDAE